ncbi:hypothetical protein IFM89_038665 [Coptis chinensis]|uniref:FAD/NAD(P)-binding oxidoreductase family protein n=1 Tax=Coptis chinensis TaxID=261450 RepID=A0A835I955_9MAGN|nr:hypothetical protein IFM89_038665 [Coptis chinensis]
MAMPHVLKSLKAPLLSILCVNGSHSCSDLEFWEERPFFVFVFPFLDGMILHIVSLQTGKVVTNVSTTNSGKFLIKIEKRTIDLVENVEANYVLVASGSNRQGHILAMQLGHSVIDPMPSLFTFKIEDKHLAELSGITFPKVKAKLNVENVRRSIPEFTQVGPMLVTHWGLSGPVILRLSAWGARTLLVDFLPDLHIEDGKSMLLQHKDQFVKQKVLNTCPPKFGLVKRFWKYVLEQEGIDGDTLWASIPKNSLISVSSLLKQCSFRITGKGQFKDEFVTAGGVPLSEISLNTMESKIQPRLFFAGEVLNVDGITGGFNFQNAWSGEYIAGSSIGALATSRKDESYGDSGGGGDDGGGGNDGGGSGGSGGGGGGGSGSSGGGGFNSLVVVVVVAGGG